MHDKTKKEGAYITFTTDSFSPFLFVQTTEKKNDTTNITKKTKKMQNIDLQSAKTQSNADQSVSINEYNVRVSEGAKKQNDGKWVWTPSDTSSGHMFIYYLNYAIPGINLEEKDNLEFTIPLHVLKDRDGNWADSLECPYLEESEVQEGDEPDFVYKIDEEKNELIIYNYKPMDSVQAGYIEIGYTTTKSTLDYKDMNGGVNLDPLKAKVTVKKEKDNILAEKETDVDPIYIDTYARLNSTMIENNPSYYNKWQDNWGEAPADAGDYYYLVWTVRSSISNTAPYDFKLDDTFTDMGGSVVGYRFSGQPSFQKKNYVENNRNGGTRYDYVLTKYKRSEADENFKENQSYTVNNKVTATLTQSDKTGQSDQSSTANSSQKWNYKEPEYQEPAGYLESRKEGSTTDYTLEEFTTREETSIDNLRYNTYLIGYPYPYTLEDGSKGGEEAAAAGKYGKKKVAYELTDDTLYLDSTSQALEDADYNITGVQWSASMRTAVYDKDKKKFTPAAIQNWAADDQITIWVRTGAKDADNAWQQAAVYDMETANYVDGSTDEAMTGKVKTNGQNLTFTSEANVKGVRLTCENAYYYTNLSMSPSVSLKATSHVKSFINDATKVIGLVNQSESKMTQKRDDAAVKTIFTRTQSGTDNIRRVTPVSSMKKNIIQTKNDKRKKQYNITWRLNAEESYADNNGTHQIRQESGCFYDLLPAGAVLNQKSIEVQASGTTLKEGNYNVRVEENYKESGRTLVTVQIKEPTTTQYQMSYQTATSYEAIQDYGRSLLNSAAYETGNNKIANGYEDNGGNITEKNLMTGLDSDTSGAKFLYAEARHYISILMAGSNGLRKLVKSEKDAQYNKESSVGQGGSYSYEVRVANDMTTRSKNHIFFDSLETYYKNGNESKPAKESNWTGTLTGIDLSVLKEQGVEPVVYLSETDGMNINNHHDLKEEKDGKPVWVEYSKFLKEHDGSLSSARAIAVDARKKTDGSSFILEGKQSLVFTIYMKAPQADKTTTEDPVAYNNIYLERDVLEEAGDKAAIEGQLIHQDYTALHYRVTSDVKLKKVDQTDGISPVSEASYLLRGTSDYGTAYETTQVTGRDGNFTFGQIEKGSYELLETSCSDDWLLNTEVYKVMVDAKGQVMIDGLSDKTEDGRYIVTDAPRVHGDLTFKKVDSITGNAINGAEFLLTGTSDYGTDVFQQAVSEGKNVGNNAKGEVTFENLELGTYKLSETKAKDGYILGKSEWTVSVNDSGVITLKDADGKEVEKNSSSTYLIKNEPLHSIRFLKTSTYGEDITLNGAVFSLTGVSDYGTNTNQTGTSGTDGLVIINNLEPGTYQLKETKAPAEHELDETAHTVTVGSDGTFEISGLQKKQYGTTSAEIYEFKNVKTTGVVKLTKIWKDNKTNAERDIPDMTISTKKPSKDVRGYTITFDANGGTFEDGTTENEMVYSATGTTPLGGNEYKIPTNDDGDFMGWYTSPTGDTEYKIASDGTIEASLTEDITVYARYSIMKYAVAIYGIGVDTLESGEAGLTFGPALGANYVQSYKNHTPDGKTKLGNNHRCVHNDSWKEIIEWNKQDPDVYEQCINKGCTHSVALKQNSTSTILNENFRTLKETGDGPSCLDYELVTNNGKCYENLRWHPNDYSLGSTSEGWGASRIRAMLNGADELTDATNSNISSDVHLSAKIIYTKENCLLATLPKELQKAIGARVVSYDSVFDSKTEENLKKTNDKLWLFSPNELGKTVSNEDYNHTLEGRVYEKFQNTGDVCASYTARNGYCINKEYGTEKSSLGAWLRSIGGYPGSVLSLEKGKVDYAYAYMGRDVSFGFTLER